MKRLKTLVLFAAFAILATAGQEPPAPPSDPSDVRLPSGKSPREEILKAEYEKALKEAAELSKLAEDLKNDLEKDDRHVLSLSSLKKTEDIEKLARRIRGRLKRY
jgi:hypothetical protein